MKLFEILGDVGGLAALLVILWGCLAIAHGLGWVQP